MEYSYTIILILCLSAVLLSAVLSHAEKTHYHDFVVQETPVKRLCMSINITTVNGMLPGPTLDVRNGDSLVIKVVNRAKYNVTVHWHGVRQIRTAWADGPEYVTQCPIRPGYNYTYRFKIIRQEGTLLWHAHSSWLRATVYGAIVIRPMSGSSYPFPKPHKEFPVVIGEWWNADPIDVVNEARRTGGGPNISDAFTINGQPGDLYNCSRKDTTIFRVGFGETVLFRVINAALNEQHFFSIAGHTMTVVGIDAAYTKPFSTSVLMLGPGQTTDVLITANQTPGCYYMAARTYITPLTIGFDNTTTTAILEYKEQKSCENREGRLLMLPSLPAFNDTATVKAFVGRLKSLEKVDVPMDIDANLVFTVGLGLFNCTSSESCGGPANTRLAASMNNVSFVFPSNYSILQAYVQGIKGGVFSSNFPPVPPHRFNYTSDNIPRALWQPIHGTEVLRLDYGTRVQLVLQSTSILAAESHPMHLHGYDFYIVATGSGNFDPAKDTQSFNLVDPPQRNTVEVPADGWAVLRFVADNPGAWLMHCHLDVHLTWGLGMVWVVENGVGEMETLEDPPKDLPSC